MLRSPRDQCAGARELLPACREAGRASLRQPGASPGDARTAIVTAVPRWTLTAPALRPPRCPGQLRIQLAEDPPGLPRFPERWSAGPLRGLPASLGLAQLQYIRTPPPAALSQAHPSCPPQKRVNRGAGMATRLYFIKEETTNYPRHSWPEHARNVVATPSPPAWEAPFLSGHRNKT